MNEPEENKTTADFTLTDYKQHLEDTMDCVKVEFEPSATNLVLFCFFV